MCKKKIIFYLSIFFLVASCGSWDNVKRGLTGAKKESADEFLVRKKDPLTLPPDFENLPSPEESEIDEDEASSFERKLQTTKSTTEEDAFSGSSSAEESILNITLSPVM